MLARLFLLFTITTTIEIFLLIEMSQRMGIRATLLLILLTGIVGAWLSKREGLRTLARVKSELAEGKIPGDALVDGLCILLAGTFLLAPGILTDVSGFLLLMPWFRKPIKEALRTRFEEARKQGMAAGRVHIVNMATGGRAGGPGMGMGGPGMGMGGPGMGMGGPGMGMGGPGMGGPRRPSGGFPNARGPIVDVTPPEREAETVSARPTPIRPKNQRAFASGDVIDVSGD